MPHMGTRQFTRDRHLIHRPEPVSHPGTEPGPPHLTPSNAGRMGLRASRQGVSLAGGDVTYFAPPGFTFGQPLIQEAPGSEDYLYAESRKQRTEADARGRLPGQRGYGAKR